MRINQQAWEAWEVWEACVHVKEDYKDGNPGNECVLFKRASNILIAVHA